MRILYIFKYLNDSNEFGLWMSANTRHFIIGAKKFAHLQFGSTIKYAFFEVDMDGNAIYYVDFFEQGFFSTKNNHESEVYMVGVPKYNNGENMIGIKDDWKKMMHYEGRYNESYFRVTEEQYNKLTKDFFESEKLSKENIKHVTYTYSELFETATP